MNYTRFLNTISRARQPSPIRMLTEILEKSPPGMISMASGMPNANWFPFVKASIKMGDGSEMNLDASDMRKALQYSPTPGLSDLQNLLMTLQKEVHQPPTFNSGDEKQTDLLVTTGSQHALCTACEMLLTSNDNVLVGSPMYPGTIAMMKPLGVNFLEIETDGFGIIPACLKQVLSMWSPNDANDARSDVPKVLYLVPNGDNPTGASLTLERKQEIYQIAQQYNLVILEDDPYYYLQFTKPKQPSFLALDVDGRVLRFDSFSKVLSAGIRIGFVTGPEALLRQINYHLMASVLHTSGISQMMVYKLLSSWGIQRFLEHTQLVADFYEDRRNVMLAAANKHLTGLAEWNIPLGGMFIWFRLIGVRDSYDLIMTRAIEKLVLLVPGNAFFPDDANLSPYVRACFSTATDEDIDEGLRRLATLIKEDQKNTC